MLSGGRVVACGNSDAKVVTAGRNTDGLRCITSFDCCMYTSRQQTAARERGVVSRLTNKEAKEQG
jgi:hypothetical protein